MAEDPKNIFCVITPRQGCPAIVPEACICARMPKSIYEERLRELIERQGPALPDRG